MNQPPGRWSEGADDGPLLRNSPPGSTKMTAVGSGGDSDRESTVDERSTSRLPPSSASLDDSPCGIDCCYFPRRYIVVLLLFFGLCVVHAQRVNVGVAVVSILDARHGQTLTLHNSAAAAGRAAAATGGDETVHSALSDIQWDNRMIGWLHAVFYVGLLISQIPCGWLVTIFPSHRLFGGCILMTHSLNFLLPLSISENIYVLTCTIRLMQGLVEGLLYPSCYDVMRHWTMPEERSRTGATVLTDAKKEQLNRFQQLFDYIVDYEQARGMISSLEASDVSRCGSHEERLKWLLRKLKEETENAQELLEVLRAESSFAWFVDCLDQIDLSQVDQEDGQQLLARTLGRLSFGADAAKRNKEESEASWSHVSEATKELNEQLKLKFRKLHTEIVNMNMSPIIDQLFQENVLSSADNKSLVKKARDPSSQAKLLLSKLHSSRNPEAFVKLRQAMQRQKAFSTIIKRLDGVNFDNDAAATERSVSSVSTGKTQTATVVERLPVAEVIVGVTSLDDELYVLRAKSDHEIEVYDCSSGSRTFKFLRHLNISGTRGLVDIASCSHQKRVYVADCVKCVIHAFLSKQQDATTKWPIGLKPASLSTTPRSSSVLVTCADVCKLREFTADGNLLREINLRPDVDGLRPTHAVATSDEKNLAAIFGDDVCLVEKSSGGILRSYGGTLGDLDADHELDSPLHLAVDKDGCVLVADCFNGRVLTLSGKLDYVGEVATREQLDWFPVKVCLDADNRRLYVAVNEFDDDTYKAGRVVVLDL